MSKIESYFHTDWAAMTAYDWGGMILTVVIFVALAVTFFNALRPKNAQELEAQRMTPLRDDE